MSNVPITPGSGANIATDTVSTEHLQIIKLGIGGVGTATLLAFGQQAMAASLPVAIANDNVVKAVGSTSYIDVTLSLDTSIYASGDVLAETQVVTNAVRANDLTGVLQSIVVVDEDDQGFGFDLVFFAENRSLGTENASPSITDANTRDCLGIVSIDATAFVDLGGARVATKAGVGLIVKPASRTRNIYVAAIARGAGTYTASGLRLRLGFLQD